MSIIHTIHPVIQLDFSVLNKYLSAHIKNIVYEKRGGNLFYYWLDKQSIRGVDVSIEKEEYIEIRNTLMSNTHDYFLTNEIIRAISMLTKGQVFDEEDNSVNADCTFNKHLIAELEKDHCKTVHFLSENKEDIAIFGPLRIVHFGKHTFSVLNPFANNPDKLTEEMFRISLHIQYNLPDYKDGSLMQIGEGESKKILQMITNLDNILISKFDFILLYNQGESPIALENIILNSILPEKWKLIDEFTFVATVLSDQEWTEFISNAIKYNQVATIQS